MQPNTKGKKVLVIEDNQYIAKVITTNFQEEFKCETSSDPEIALGKLISGQDHPDAIIINLNMKGMSGEKFLEEIRKNPHTEKLPIVMISSEKASSIRVKMFRKGVDDFVVKPFNPEELLVRVERLFK